MRGERKNTKNKTREKRDILTRGSKRNINTLQKKGMQQSTKEVYRSDCAVRNQNFATSEDRRGSNRKLTFFTHATVRNMLGI